MSCVSRSVCVSVGVCMSICACACTCPCRAASLQLYCPDSKMRCRQVPTNWRPLIEDQNTMATLLQAYNTSAAPRSAQAMECLSQLASVRRSLFPNQETRQAFLQRVLTAVVAVLRGSERLGEEENFHEFCRLLSRVKSNFQLGEMIKCGDVYQELIQLVAQFTVQSLQVCLTACVSTFVAVSVSVLVRQSVRSCFRSLDSSPLASLSVVFGVESHFVLSVAYTTDSKAGLCCIYFLHANVTLVQINDHIPTPTCRYSACLKSLRPLDNFLCCCPPCGGTKY